MSRTQYLVDALMAVNHLLNALLLGPRGAVDDATIERVRREVRQAVLSGKEMIQGRTQVKVVTLALAGSGGEALYIDGNLVQGRDFYLFATELTAHTKNRLIIIEEIRVEEGLGWPPVWPKNLSQLIDRDAILSQRAMDEAGESEDFDDVVRELGLSQDSQLNEKHPSSDSDSSQNEKTP